MSGVHWGTGWEYRYSGARRGIGGKRGHWWLIEVLGAIRGHWGVRGVGGVRGRGVRG